VSRVPVFGMTFAQLVARFPNTKLPPFFTKCLQHIENKGTRWTFTILGNLLLTVFRHWQRWNFPFGRIFDANSYLAAVMLFWYENILI